ncbi:MAG: GNAT family N-acetyltransferase [Cyanobacteria bacterium P01_D01_bin.71]
MSRSAQFEPVPCHVRPAVAADLLAVAEVLVSSFYPPLGWQRWLHPLFRFSIYEDLKQRGRAGHEYYCCLAAIAPGRHDHQPAVVGTVEITQRPPNLWTFQRSRQIYLSNLAVKASHRRQGVARRLLQAAEKQALSWGFQELSLHVMTDNTRARQLYQKLGYQLQRVEPTFLSILNLQPARLRLYKGLTSPAQPSRCRYPEPPPRDSTPPPRLLDS